VRSVMFMRVNLRMERLMSIEVGGVPVPVDGRWLDCDMGVSPVHRRRSRARRPCYPGPVGSQGPSTGTGTRTAAAPTPSNNVVSHKRLTNVT